MDVEQRKDGEGDLSNTNDDKRTKTLNALDEYIQAQRSLLERAQCDIERLRQLRCRATATPREFMASCLGNGIAGYGRGEGNRQLDTDVTSHGRLSDLYQEVRGGGGRKVLDRVEWKLFDGQDPHSLRTLGIKSRQLHPLTVFPDTIIMPSLQKTPGACAQYLRPPSLVPCPSPPFPSSGPRRRPTPLQEFVRNGAKEILMPSLVESNAHISSFPPDSGAESDTNGKAASNKKNKNSHRTRHTRSSTAGTTTADSSSALTRPRGPGGLFKKRETVPVNAVNTAEATAPESAITNIPLPMDTRKRHRSTMDALVLESVILPKEEPVANSRAKRVRRDSTKLDAESSAMENPTRRRSKSDGVVAGSRTGTNSRGSPPQTRSASRSLSVYTAASSSNTPDPEPLARITIRIPPRPSIASISPSKGRAKGGQKRKRNGRFSTSSRFKDNDASNVSSRAASVTHTAISTTTDQDVENLEHHVKFEEEDPEDLESTSMSVRTESEPQSLPISDDEGEARAHIRNGDDEYDDERQEQENGREEVTTVVVGQSKDLTRRQTETYNMAWSDAEHKLLEKLMLEHPHGMKQRWAAISRGMGGRRTPRQVASHVQKYFAKLKQWGLER